jgi:hypothetical protein
LSQAILGQSASIKHSAGSSRRNFFNRSSPKKALRKTPPDLLRQLMRLSGRRAQATRAETIKWQSSDEWKMRLRYAWQCIGGLASARHALSSLQKFISHKCHFGPKLSHSLIFDNYFIKACDRHVTLGSWRDVKPLY